MINNWIDAAVNGAELIAPDYESINSLNISNAIYLSAWDDTWADLPVDEDRFYEKLQEKIETSTFKKTVMEKDISFASTAHKSN